jgi:DNA-binding response OmpR family regulator
MTKVLLIEDDDETAGEITAELADRGFDVEWSSNGLDGLAKARDLRPDAMIVDRLLPGMDGLTVIESLRKEQVRTPMLLEEVWNYKFVPATNLVDVHMGRVRHKIDGPGEAPMIHNVRGAGFILRAVA